MQTRGIGRRNLNVDEEELWSVSSSSGSNGKRRIVKCLREKCFRRRPDDVPLIRVIIVARYNSLPPLTFRESQPTPTRDFSSICTLEFTSLESVLHFWIWSRGNPFFVSERPMRVFVFTRKIKMLKNKNYIFHYFPFVWTYLSRRINWRIFNNLYAQRITACYVRAQNILRSFPPPIVKFEYWTSEYRTTETYPHETTTTLRCKAMRGGGDRWETSSRKMDGRKIVAVYRVKR